MNRNGRHTIIITDPEDPSGERQIKITIPSFTKWKEYQQEVKKNPKQKKKIFCGNDNNINLDNYEDYGTRFQCLRKGFGAGLNSIFSENEIESEEEKQDG